MLYTLRNGKTIELTTEEFLEMDDIDFEELEALNYGMELNDPFAISVLHYGSKPNEFDELEDLLEIEMDEKLRDPDFYNEDELEV